MIFFPGCKINIGLHVVSKRADGYHDLETLMFPVRGLCDAVEIIRSRTTGVEFTSSGLPSAVPYKKICVSGPMSRCGVPIRSAE